MGGGRDWRKEGRKGRGKSREGGGKGGEGGDLLQGIRGDRRPWAPPRSELAKIISGDDNTKQSTAIFIKHRFFSLFGEIVSDTLAVPL